MARQAPPSKPTPPQPRGPSPPLSAAAIAKREALDSLRRLKPFTPDPSRHVYISPTEEDQRHTHRSYYLFRKQWETWAAARNGKIEFLRGFPGGDYLMQLSPDFHRRIVYERYPIIRMPEGSWQIKPSNSDDLCPSCVIEGIDPTVTPEQIGSELRKNSDILDIDNETLRTAKITFFRFYRRSGYGPPSPSNSGRLFADAPIIAKILSRQGFFIGALPVYARPFSAPK